MLQQHLVDYIDQNIWMVAPIGGTAIQLHFIAGGQSMSIYPKDDITTMITNELQQERGQVVRVIQEDTSMLDSPIMSNITPSCK